MNTEITPEIIINARKERTYCDGCTHLGIGKLGDKICYRVIAKQAACAADVRYWKCSYQNKNNECKFYKIKKLKKEEKVSIISIRSIGSFLFRCFLRAFRL